MCVSGIKKKRRLTSYFRLLPSVERGGSSVPKRSCVFIAIALTAAQLSACRPAQSTLDGFEHPYWARIGYAPVVEDEAELQALWLSTPRCCSKESVENNRIFYRACADAIERHPRDDHLVVKCLWLMQVALDEGSWRLNELIVNRYFHHKDSLQNCANCAPGDTVSRVSQELAAHYAARGDLTAAIALLERVTDERGAETSPWVRIEGYTRLCELYVRTQISSAREARIRAAHLELEQLKDERTIAPRFGSFDRACGLIHRTEVEAK
jgi:hypothetical protein